MALLRGAGTGAGHSKAPATLSRGMVTGAEAGCVLAGLTLGACTGAGTVRTSVPMPSRVVDRAGGGVDQGPTPGPAVLPTAVCPHCVATSSATIWVSFFPCWPSHGFWHHCNITNADPMMFACFSASRYSHSSCCWLLQTHTAAAFQLPAEHIPTTTITQELAHTLNR